MLRDPCNIFYNIFAIVSNKKTLGCKKTPQILDVTVHLLKPGHPTNENQSDGRTETIYSNIFKSSQ